MSRYIDADTLNKELQKRWNINSDHDFADKEVWRALENAPTIDAVSVVRCKECKHGEYRKEFDDYECHSSGCGLVHDADFYCADGEREGE